MYYHQAYHGVECPGQCIVLALHFSGSSPWREGSGMTVHGCSMGVVL